MTDFGHFDNFIMSHFGSARLHTGKKGQKEVLLDCPKCGAEMRCSLNPKLRLMNCYRCGWQRLIDWLVEVCGMPRGDAYKLLKNQEVESLEDYDRLIDEFMTDAPVLDLVPGEGIVEYVKTFLPIGSNIVANLVSQEYIESRGFTLEYAAAWGLMYADTATKFHDRLIMPCWEDGKIVYFQDRSLINAEPKYYNPSTKDGCDRNLYLWNIDVARQYDTVYVTEGVFNGMSIGPNVVSPFGKAMSEHQLMKLRDKLRPGTKVVFCFDHGAEEQAHDAAVALSGSFQTSVLWMPDERDLNDWLKSSGYEAIQSLLTHNVMSPEAAYYLALTQGRIKGK